MISLCHTRIILIDVKIQTRVSQRYYIKMKIHSKLTYFRDTTWLFIFFNCYAIKCYYNYFNVLREYYLLLDDSSKTRMKIRASAVIQHEFTHQWFGNLVTCKSWNYTWLNEGFARYFQYFATEMVRFHTVFI